MRRRRSTKRLDTLEKFVAAARARPGQETADEMLRRGGSPAMQRFNEPLERPQRELDRAMASSWLRKLGDAFRRSGGNPLFAWDAWRESRRSGLPLPDWAASVLDRWATGLGKLARDRGTVATEDVSQALGLAGAESDKSAFFLYRKWLRDRDYFESVAELLAGDPSLKVSAAIAAVSKREDISRHTIRRACEGMLEILGRESR